MYACMHAHGDVQKSSAYYREQQQQCSTVIINYMHVAGPPIIFVWLMRQARVAGLKCLSRKQPGQVSTSLPNNNYFDLDSPPHAFSTAKILPIYLNCVFDFWGTCYLLQLINCIVRTYYWWSQICCTITVSDQSGRRHTQKMCCMLYFLCFVFALKERT